MSHEQSHVWYRTHGFAHEPCVRCHATIKPARHGVCVRHNVKAVVTRPPNVVVCNYGYRFYRLYAGAGCVQLSRVEGILAFNKVQTKFKVQSSKKVQHDCQQGETEVMGTILCMLREVVYDVP